MSVTFVLEIPVVGDICKGLDHADKFFINPVTACGLWRGKQAFSASFFC